ncbi:NAD(P)/FAD-dependent oxidoreductase [Microlunatus sp. GCM10028923]|uniref:NAD(P)/FAD-dependent oxidoreductase n=1 Tax=Microlunatus sp. GCM10028923 TaxID=3273400 RepID=UPI00361ADE7F
MNTHASRPRTALVIGAGMVGLATAWHLQRRGIDVTVIDRSGVAAGSSWGNAGWLTPGLAMPLAEPSLWTYAPRALLDPNAALHIPVRLQPRLWQFLLRFIGHATTRTWRRTMADLTPIDRLALDAYDELKAGGVAARSREVDFLVGFESVRQARAFRHELAGVEAAGQQVPLRRLGSAQELVPQVSDLPYAYALGGQRIIEPGPFVESLADAVRDRGAKIITGEAVRDVEQVPGGGVRVDLGNGRTEAADVAVLATGAWLPELARPLGVRTPVQAGRGYSFTVEGEIDHPVYFPARRVACTPYQGRFRIAGTMEFRGPDEPLQPRRIEAIVNSVRDLLPGLDLDRRTDEWVGSRPVTTDGLPLVGATRLPGVYVAGGHGMWGIVLGPATGRLLADQIATGTAPEALRPFDPLR